MCSWICQHPQIEIPGGKQRQVPHLQDIQTALVQMQDKSDSFIDSKQWIGSFEVSLCLDYFYDVPGKIIHVECGSSMVCVLTELYDHFQSVGAPIMMGNSICWLCFIVGVLSV